MARPLRIEYPNACYHVINRGNQRNVVFHDDWYYAKFIEKLGHFVTEFRVIVYAYCCMPNHFHLYIRTREANLSRFMQSLLTSFCVLSNKKRRSSGHIFQGRFKAQLVEDECYRSRLSRYIHLNPIRTQAFHDSTLEERHKCLREYKWSTYRYYLGLHKIPKWLNTDPILSCWGDKKREQMRNYASYVEEGLLKDLESPFNDIVEQSIIGSDRFVERVKREYLLLRSSQKDQEPDLVHLQQSFMLDEIINHVASEFKIEVGSIVQRRSKHRDARRLAMYCACNYCRHRHSLSELATRFNVSVSALTQARDHVMNTPSPNLRKKLKKIVNAIANT